MTALVTGASGFLGRHLVRHLQSLGRPVATLGRAGQHVVDAACSAGCLAPVLAAVRPRMVFHLAAVTAPASVEEAYRVNAVYAANLLAAAALLAPPPPVVLIGSAAEYGPPRRERTPIAEDHPCRPATLYGITKLAQTLHGTAETRVPVTVLRLFNLIGPGMPPHLGPRAFLRQALGGAPVVEVDRLDTVRDYIDVADACRAIVALADEPQARGRVLNLCSGHPLAMGEIVAAIARQAPRRFELRTRPAAAGHSPFVVGDPAAAAALGVLLPPPELDRVVQAMIAGEAA